MSDASRGSKSKSRKRFEQLNILVDQVIRELPARHGLALLVCFRHAGLQGRFRLSARRLGESLGVDLRTAQRVVKDLERWECVLELAPEQGTIPRLMRITGRQRRVDKTVA